MKCIFQILALAACGFAPAAVVAAPIQLANVGGSTYTPGLPITFDVLLPAINDLGAYNVDLLLDGSTGVAGTDFYFDVAATIPAAFDYVFPTNVNFFDAINVDIPSRHRITLSDFDLAGVNVLPGSNDYVAHVVIQTNANYMGTLSVSIDTDGLILDTPDTTPTSVQGFNTIKVDTQAAGAIVLNPVPEPSTFILMLIWAAVLPGQYGRLRLGC